MDRGSIFILMALALLAICIAGLVAPDAIQEGDAGAIITDREGPVVSLAPCITGTLLAIGAERSIALVSDFCPELEGVSRAGTALAPDLERILRSGSRTLLVRRAAGVPIDELRRVGDPVELSWASADQVADSIRIIGRLVGRESAAMQLATRFEQLAVAQVAADAPRVLLVIGADLEASGGPWVIKPNSMHGAVLKAAGFRNAIENPMAGTPQISFERLLAIDPDIILHLSTGSRPGNLRPVLERYKHLDGLSAVASGAVGEVIGSRILDEGPELLDLVDSIGSEVQRLFDGGARW